jgi:hypothetical protein
MADINFGILRQEVPFQFPEGGFSGARLKGMQQGSLMNLQNQQAALTANQATTEAQKPALVQAQTGLTNAQTGNTQADTAFTMGPKTDLTQAQTGLTNAQTTESGTRSTHNLAMAQQVAAQTQMINLQTTIAKASLANDVISAVSDQKSYDNALSSLKKMGIDIGDVPSSYDPAFVAQRQAMSSHYLDVMKTEGQLAMKQIGAQMQAANVNATYIQHGMQPPMNPGGAPQGSLNMPGFGGGNPMMAGNGMSPQAQQQGAGGIAVPQSQQIPVGMDLQPQQQMPMQAPGGGIPGQTAEMPSFGAPNAAGTSDAGNFPGQLEQAKTTGKEQAESFSKYQQSLVNQAQEANRTLIDVGLARDALSKGISPGKYTGIAREYLTPSAAQQLDKTTQDLLRSTIKSLQGTGNRVMQSEIQSFLKGLPSNTTAPEVNRKILDVVELTARKSVLDAQAVQQMKSMGITDPLKVNNILQQTYESINPIDYKTGTVNTQNLKQYFPAFKEAVQGGSLVNDANVNATAQKYGMTPDQVRQLLQSGGQ